MVGWASNRWHSLWCGGLRPRSLTALLFTIVCVGIATGVRTSLGLISPDSAAFAPYYSATLVAALVSGAEAGALAACLGGIVAMCFFAPPDWGLAPFRLEQLVSLALYGTSSVVIIWAAQSYRGLLQRLRAEETMRQLLNRELVHRSKNMLANVQAIVRQALRGQEDLCDKVSGRIAALAGTNSLLAQSEWQGASLREILVGELTPYGLSRFQLKGDDVACLSAVEILLAMVFHELTTNAAKYGALSCSDGRIDISWSNGSGPLTIEWVERGGPEPTAPTHEGFGTKLLRSGVRQFQGAVDCRFEPTGFRCELSLTLPEEPKREDVLHGDRNA